MSYFQGQIVLPRGPPDFGWDPVFQPKGFEETYAELDSVVKNTISHRYKALRALSDHFIEQKTNDTDDSKATELQPPDVKKIRTGEERKDEL